MKSRRRKIVGISVLLLVLVVGGAALVGFYPMLRMKPLDTGVVGDSGITAVRCGINSIYLIASDDGYILVDAGTDKEQVAAALQELAVDPDEVAVVLLTHSDYDHVGSLALFEHAQIYMGEDELQMLDGETKRNAMSKNSLPDGVAVDSISLLGEQEELVFGGHTIATYKTPGHTLGLVSYLVDDAYLFTGDAFRIRNGAMAVHPYTMDEDMANASIAKLGSLIDEDLLVLTAHYGQYQ